MKAGSQVRSLTVATLEDWLAADDHLAYAGSLIEGHEWPPGKAEELRGSLERIHTRRQDSCLYLALIGEFNSGKSTLVNALLGTELLPTSVVQATTAAAVLMRHAPRPAVVVKLKSGETKSFVLSGPGTAEKNSGSTPVGNLAEPLSRYVADEAIARTVEQVTVLGPAPALTDGLVLIDTPGTNVDNPRHVEVATLVLRESCDAALVLIPATIPLSKSFADFLTAQREEGLHRCIFLVTMIDRVSPADRESLLRTVEHRVRTMLGVERPRILAVSALAVLRGNETAAEGDWGRLAADFRAVEGQLREVLARQRVLIVLERLASLLGRLYEEMSAGLAALERSYVRDHEALEASRISDLAGFASESKAAHRAVLDHHAVLLKTRIREELRRARQEIEVQLLGELRRAVNETGLRNVMKASAPAAVRHARAVLETWLAALLGELHTATVREAEAFEKEFLGLYRSLAMLGGQRTVEEAAPEPVRALQEVSIGGSLQGLAQLADSQQKFSEGLMKSMALAGAAVGAMIGGPVGAFFGGIAGLVAGKLAGPSIDQLRTACQEQTRKVLSEIFGAAETGVLVDFDARARAAVLRVDGVIDLYLQRYELLVRRMIAEDQRKAGDLEARRQRVRRDAAELDRRRKALDEARDGLHRIREI